MFNQKVNGYTSENPDYLNYSYGTPQVSPLTIHNCGTTVLHYIKPQKESNGLPLQTWCSKNVAVESFGVRPIVNPKDYFENIKNYLSSIVYTDSIDLKQSQITKENFYLFNDNGIEPDSSFLQAINLEVSDKLSYLMSASSNEINIFKNYNPICEGFVITDIEILTYRSYQNDNHFFHKVLFSAFNTTRYNTISFKAELYQDTTGMINEWNNAINQVENSQNLTKNKNSSNSIIYVSMIDLMNNQCVNGDDNSCFFKGQSLSKFTQKIDDNYNNNPKQISWLDPNSMSDDIYTQDGYYDADGNIKITDSGPSNLDQLIQNFSKKVNTFF